jgi:non-specific serine/threonine protein kinase/serine/threonine-protein kinase
MLDKALPPMEEVLAARKEVLGPDHRHTLHSMSQLAYLYHSLGRPDRSLALNKEALELRKAKLGPDDPDTLVSMNNVASNYLNAGRYEEARRLHEEVLRVRTAKLGPEHLDTLNSMNSLGACLTGTGQPGEAAALLRKVLELRRARLGPDHPDTLTTLNNLAGAYKASRKPELAVALYEDSLSASEAKLGPDHPATILALNNLAWAYQDVGKTELALTLLRRAGAALEARQFRDAFAADLLHYLVASLEEAERYAEAESWRRKWLASVRATAGADSVSYAVNLTGLGDVLISQGKWAEAEAALREALAVHEAKQPGAFVTHDTRAMLGSALAGLRKFAEAEPLMTRGYEGLASTLPTMPGDYRRKVVEAHDRLVRLYEAWGKPEKAAEWRTKLPRPGETKPKW